MPTRFPKIPQKGSHQWKTAIILAKNANDDFLKHVYITLIKGLTSAQLANAMDNLRDKGWPIESEPCENESGYRLDKQMWAIVKQMMTARLGLSS